MGKYNILIILIFLVLILSFTLATLEDFISWFSDTTKRLGTAPIGPYSEGETPPVSLTCEREVIYTNWTNNCTEIGCKEGWWEIKNIQNAPLNESPVLQKINVTTGSTPTYKIFGPVKTEGEILTMIICNDPEFETNHTTYVLKGPHIDCPATCSAGADCICSINQCSEGLLMLRNFNGNPLINNVVRDINNITFNYTFKTYGEGKIEARMRCTEPYFEHQVKSIVITEPGKKFYMSDISCNQTYCSVVIDKNSEGKTVNILVQLFEEPYGVIYYTGSADVSAGFTGEKEIALTKLKDCTEGADLKVLAIASSSGQRIDRLKEDYICK